MDITGCLNKFCEQKDDCYRANVTWSDLWQSVAYFKPEENGECSNYWPFKENKYGK